MSSEASDARVTGRSHRLIASRFPTVGVFDDIATDAEELKAAFLLEAATNDRMTTLVRRITLFSPGDIPHGPTASLVMAAFLHADERGGRFTDGRLGGWYAALELETALAETIHHATRRLSLSDGGFPNTIEMRELIADIDADLIDLRGQRETRRDLYDPDHYQASQAFAALSRWPASGRGANGIVYDSVRREEGTCVCLFRPSLVPLPVIQGDHFRYSWDAAGEIRVSKISSVDFAFSA
ncbi:hypothetical protein FHS85_002797 [Rhodoligotrophos appendicifer]|uniref:RES family NAD+ phosphorylase n=1 Tax=Rhodoligotrophos appendicifer TaxID=987056 RepID=UPI0014784952|nr:RES family NAD+ phosphorylase [Rhodoligotrophos appendicifer]